MMRLRDIVCGTDLSEASDEALRQAAALAAAAGARLTVVHVVAYMYGGGGGVSMVPLMAAGATSDVDRHVVPEVRAQIERVVPGCKAEIEVRAEVGSAHSGVLACAESRHADLVVVGASRATGLGRLALGSVAEMVVRYAAAPVLVARLARTTGKVLAATDLSEASLGALVAASLEAQRRHATLTVVHCMEFPPTIMLLGSAPLVPLPPDDPNSRVEQCRRAEARVKETLARLHVVADVVVDPGTARAVVPDLAGRLPAELVVVGARGRNPLLRLLLGGVSESVVRRAPCSVLVARAPAAAPVTRTG